MPTIPNAAGGEANNPNPMVIQSAEDFGVHDLAGCCVRLSGVENGLESRMRRCGWIFKGTDGLVTEGK